MIKQEHNNAFIAEYLDAYRTYSDIDYAVMISGPWGCGKTHFIREYIDRCRAKMLDPTKNGCWYVSLHGVMSTAEIDARLYEAAHAKLGSKNAQISYHLIRGLVEVGISVGCNVEADKVSDLLKSGGKLFRELKKFCDKSNKPSLIVFDDFERSLMDKSALLGYISEFLKESVPVVVVGAENEIVCGSAKGKAKDYQRMREKVIGKTFVLREELHDLFGVLVGTNVFSNAENLLLSAREEIVASLRRGRNKEWQCNYRALKHAFRELDYVLGGMKKTKAYQDAKFLKNFVLVFVMLGYEIQTGAVTRDDFDQFESNKGNLVQFFDGWNFSLSANPDGKPCLVLPLSLLRDIFFGTIPNRTRIAAEIESLPMFCPKKEEDWFRLWKWFMLPDDKAGKVIELVRKGLESHKYKRAGEIVQIFVVLAGLSEKHAIPESVAKVKAWFKRYVADLSADLVVDEVIANGLADSWNGCMFWKVPHCRQQPCVEFLALIRKGYEERARKDRQRQYESLLYGFGTNVEALCSQLRNEYPGKMSLLENADPKRFFAGFANETNESKVKIKVSLDSRYSRGSNPTLRTREAKFLLGLATEIRKWKKTNKRLCGQPSFVCMNELLGIVADSGVKVQARR